MKVLEHFFIRANHVVGRDLAAVRTLFAALDLVGRRGDAVLAKGVAAIHQNQRNVLRGEALLASVAYREGLLHFIIN